MMFKGASRAGQTLPVQLPSQDNGDNVGFVATPRDLGYRERDFNAAQQTFAGLQVGDLPIAEHRMVLSDRGRAANAYQMGEFIDNVEGVGGGTRPLEPISVRGRMLDMDATLPDLGGPSIPGMRPPDPTLRSDNQRELQDELATQKMMQDV
jgi:hypothetical protein